MKTILCFGELLLRLSPQLNGEWIRQNTMPVFIGGAELNAATALAKWGVSVSYCTALPDNYLSKEIIASLNEKKIYSDKIILRGNRIGSYYLPQGADLKNAGVIYDRAFSSFWELKPGELNWEEVFREVSWFHFSAISPALNENLALVCKEAVKEASSRGIMVSVDLNYRSRLWQYGKDPVDVMPDLVQHCDLIMGNIWAEEKMLGIPVPTDLGDSKEAYIQASLKTSETVRAKYPKCRQVANTFRFDEGEGIRYYATLVDGSGLWISNEHRTGMIIDKVGSGDTFMAGLIYGNHNRLSAQETIQFAAAAAFNKLFIRGDATTASVEEIRKGFLNYA